jgi:hypothetical protein
MAVGEARAVEQRAHGRGLVGVGIVHDPRSRRDRARPA